MNADKINLVVSQPPPATFDELCDYLATVGHGFTLWLGAGASISASGGKSPTWSSLIKDLKREAVELPSDLPRYFDSLDMPDQLDWISSRLGHAQFRIRLRERLVQPLLDGPLPSDTQLNHAVIGARASQIVSFNLEILSAYPFASLHGQPVMRPYLVSEAPVLAMSGQAGQSGVAVYFPHGLLDTHGSCVMTRSEYDEHKASLAASTAVSLCLGGDLLILGMSLGDSYLRQAILSGRRWIRNVFWVGASFPYAEWARVGRVTCIKSEHASTWSGLANAFLAHDQTGTLSQLQARGKSTLPAFMESLATHIKQIPAGLVERARVVLQDPRVDAATIQRLADANVDLGIPVPDEIREHPLWRH